MKVNVKYLIIVLALLSMLPLEVFAQQRITERGTPNFRKVGVHRGNQVRTVFTNYGVIAQPGTEGPRGAWRYDANGYVGDVSPLVGLRLPIRDWRPDSLNRPDTIYSVIITPVDRPGGGEGGGGGSYTFEPIPGFANPFTKEVGKGVAMSHQPETWPPFWPDYPDWTYSGDPIIIDGKDVTPQVDWNGFFGKGQLNADQESYFWMDDNRDQEAYLLYGFLPDSLDASRRGQAIQVSVRGLQWSNFLAQDVIFWLYNIKNDGTENYDQAVFGVLVGTYVGVESPEWNDDVSFFDIREAITYTWDFDHYISPSANPKWLPDPTQVGYIAYAFLESPGNEYDGIDNDADNSKGYDCFVQSANYFTEADFQPRTVQAGQKLILIDKNTFQRTTFTMPNDTVTVYSMGVPFFLQPGVTQLKEGDFNQQTSEVNPNSIDGIDNDLDGIIDESYLVHYRVLKIDRTGQVPIVLIDQLAPVMYKDFVGNLGTSDKMLDESRSDLVDNDCDWDAEFDDVGADGKAGTNDFGEGDGIPTPGEPNFDATDVDESDQIGLTSFQYFVPAGDITMSDDFDMWRRMKPGFFQVPRSIVNNVAIRGEDGDFIYGSGYFPLLSGKTERFSLALAFGADFPAVLKTKQIAQTIYNANYNFPKPPEKPTVTAVAGDGKVILYWDRVAEESVDPTLRIKDFEGYKIYKGTDPDLSDALQITDFNGNKVFYKPIAQFDLINGIKGLFVPSAILYELTSGAPFYLGSDNGIQNFYVDNDVINGRTYYYAVVAYDRGDATKDIFPSENTRFISKDALGNISTDINTVAIIPNAPVAGYVPPASGLRAERESGYSNAVPYYEVLDPTRVADKNYKVVFNDKYFVTPGNIKDSISISDTYSVIDLETNHVVINNAAIQPENGIVFNGTRLSIDPSYQSLDSIKLDRSRSGWNHIRPGNLKITVDQFISPNLVATKYPRDYMLVFSDTYADSSNKLTRVFGNSAPPAKLVNFRAYDITDRNNPIRVQFGFNEPSPYRRDTVSFNDVIILSDAEGKTFSWRITFSGDSSSNYPVGGDTLFIYITKPISGNDVFKFSTSKPAYDPNKAIEQLERVKAVPNPYVVSNVYEQPLPPTVRGRGERVIYFTNLPPKSRVHIYTSSGNHVRTIEHDGDLNDGTVVWDVRTKEGLDVAYGVYFYVVEMDGVSDKKTGKLAIIK
ncbi:Hypothetical protein IALB_0487 [Ignavibacterium album JCM 16511]|uniref:FlgD Ig-like domain-containing protein n=1 Tax=Ignavibacterium album (strain DSM 19864 / JCM 16511 / NBRC 101810 / Mat9-16) TaxID=945713 RepID=I0AGU2_IGNAJ|nr:hypothetical protein [Ignavibacterium album]AFH48199.1 Hypothetical protein IALB_0487 [Ignavibacterium album JCM 16511]